MPSFIKRPVADSTLLTCEDLALEASIDCSSATPRSTLLPIRSDSSPMLELRCTVRKCERSLELKDSDNQRAGLTCAAGHHFDQAKEGYWNLTQPQDKKSLNPGDNRDAVLARHRWLQGGYTEGLVSELQSWIKRCGTKPRVVDLG